MSTFSLLYAFLKKWTCFDKKMCMKWMDLCFKHLCIIFQKMKIFKIKKSKNVFKLLSNKGLKIISDHCQEWICPSKYFHILLSRLNKFLMLWGARFWTKTKQKTMSTHGMFVCFVQIIKLSLQNPFPNLMEIKPMICSFKKSK